MRQATDPFFKTVFDFLACYILPRDVKTAGTIRTGAEQNIMCDRLLFFINIAVMLLLAVPDTMVEKISANYEDNLVSRHQRCYEDIPHYKVTLLYEKHYSSCE